jgi:hypothetical protein
MNIPLFPANMEILSQDMQNAFNLINTDFQTFINTLIYSSNTTVILTGLQVQANSTPDGGITVTAGIAVSNGQIINIPSNQQVNVISGTYTWGTPLGADSTNPRIDLIVCQYQTQATNVQNRPFKDPTTGTVTYSNVALIQQDYFALNVIHGTPSSTPVAPSVPSGWFALAQIYIPAGATTIQQANITDLTSQYRTSGGWLKKVSGGRIWVNDSQAAEIDTISGIKLMLGNTSYIFDNTTNGYLDISGNTNGIRLLSSLLANQGITIPAGQTFTNNGSYAGSPIVTSITAGQGISVINPTSPGPATVSVTNVPNSALVGPLVSSITAGQGISVSNPSGVGAATVSIPNGGVTASMLASGAAVANIGYTPVNKAGDTMTGDLTINAGGLFAFGPLNEISVGTTTTPTIGQGTIRFASNGPGANDGAFIEYCPPSSGNTANIINITSYSGGFLSALNIKANTTTINGNTVWHAGNSPSASIITLYTGRNGYPEKSTWQNYTSIFTTRLTWDSSFATGRNIYFEVDLAVDTSGYTAYAVLRNITAGTNIVILSTTSISGPNFIRSSAISIPNGAQIEVGIYSNSGSANAMLSTARLIIM